MRRLSICAALTVSALAACQVEGSGPRLETTTRPSMVSNGKAFNGTEMSGLEIEAIYPNGINFNGISFNGISFNGISFNGISLNGTALNGISFNGISFNGTDFIGATADAVVSTSGETTTIRIDDVWRSMPESIYYHLISYKIGEEVTCTGKGKRNKVCEVAPIWAPVCGNDSHGNPVAAILLEGRWSYPSAGGDGSKIDDPDAITIACQGAALAKCVEMGYRPWEGLGDHHQACTRMVRADYCGTGLSHTVNGWQINVYDNDGIQADATDEFPFEAEWSTDGATCLNERRTKTVDYSWWSKVSVSFDGEPLDCEIPVVVGCGDTSSPQPGTLIFNESEVVDETGGAPACNGVCEPVDYIECMCLSDCPGYNCV